MVISKKIEERPVKNTTECARQVINFSTIERTDRFDKPNFDPEKFIEKLVISSPKLEAMLRKIEELDRQDYLIHRKLYKHFIFTDIRKGGAKIIASGMIAAGYIPVIKPKGSRIVLDHQALAQKSDSKFALLSSTAVWDATVTTQSAKEILSAFNKRPDNIFGKDIRFIVLDSGYKEGVDLFDVKYCHIFEQQKSDADITQAIGRGTRFCGQSGLKFPWFLQVFNYKSIKNNDFLTNLKNKLLLRKEKDIYKTLQERDQTLNKRIVTESAFTELLKENAVDALLTQNVSNSIKNTNKELAITGAVIASTALVGGLIYNRNQPKN
jgi:hypothetical protein